MRDAMLWSIEAARGIYVVDQIDQIDHAWHIDVDERPPKESMRFKCKLFCVKRWSSDETSCAESHAHVQFATFCIRKPHVKTYGWLVAPALSFVYISFTTGLLQNSSLRVFRLSNYIN
jgi:hypothetical protein